MVPYLICIVSIITICNGTIFNTTIILICKIHTKLAKNKHVELFMLCVSTLADMCLNVLQGEVQLFSENCHWRQLMKS